MSDSRIVTREDWRAAARAAGAHDISLANLDAIFDALPSPSGDVDAACLKGADGYCLTHDDPRPGREGGARFIQCEAAIRAQSSGLDVYVPTPDDLDQLCARIAGTGYASEAVEVIETWTREHWGVESAFTTSARLEADR